MNDDLKRKLNAIVGSALRALAESGAPDDLLGSFAADHREKVAGILGLVPQPQETPDLVTIVEQAVERVMQRHVAASPTGSRATTVRKYVLVDGKRTSVTIKAATFSELLAREGGNKEALRVVNQLADGAPDDVGNRSKWVEERLQALLNANSATTSSSAARH